MRWLEGGTEHDVFSVGDAALRAAGAVSRGANTATLADELVVVRAAAQYGAGEAAADLKTFRCGQREHGLGEVGFETIKDRRAEARRKILDDAADYAADGIAIGTRLADEGVDLGGGGGVWAAGGRSLDLFERGRFGGGRHAHVADAFDPGDDAGAASVLQYRLGDGAGSDAGRGLAGGGTAAAFDGTDAVLGVIGEVGM